jgi:hypothetical protein
LRFPGFIGPSYTLPSVNVDCQRCVNLYPEMNDLGTGKEREIAALLPTPGLRLLCTLAESPVRGLHRASNGELYAVGGNKLYQISSSWVATELGTLDTTSGAVSMADNGTYVVVVDGTSGYTFQMATDTFAEINDANFYPADQVTFQDGYFLFNKSGTGIFFHTELNDVTFSGTDIATVEGSPDSLIGLISANQNLYLLGSQSTEVFYNTGDAASTFQRIQGAISSVGCAAAHTIARLDGAVYFLGGDEHGFGIVYRMKGYQAERISTAAVEGVIRDLDPTTISTARAWVYQDGGHSFYCLNLPGAEATWVYDAATGLWHERCYRDLFDLERHRADCHANAHGEHVVGDYETGALYALDPDTYTDNTTPIVRMRTAPHFSQGLKFIRHNRFQLDMETGVGLDGSGNGTDPQAILQWSDDGGHTWSNERYADIGAIGQKKTRVVWRRLGSSRDRVYRVTVADPVKVVLIGAEMDVEEGTS